MAPVLLLAVLLSLSIPLCSRVCPRDGEGGKLLQVPPASNVVIQAGFEETIFDGDDDIGSLDGTRGDVGSSVRCPAAADDGDGDEGDLGNGIIDVTDDDDDGSGLAPCSMAQRTTPINRTNSL